ncbi:MAG TPA: DUF3108 domain-containing protein [Nitrospiria bacterium]|nr:DUF3108 domain-containing protein [Nitrospiria bacterium]
MYRPQYPLSFKTYIKKCSGYKPSFRTGAILLFITLFLLDSEAVGRHTAKVKPDDHVRSLWSGEKLVFDITWMGISAGTASLEIRDRIKMNGREVYHIVSTARSNNIVSLIYPVDDLIETFVDTEWIYPYRISINKKEGRRKKDKQIVFDQSGHTAREINGEREIISEVPPDVQDPLSCLYFFRTFKDLGDGKIHTIDVYDSKKNWRMEVKVLGREQVTTPAGTFNAVKVKPEIYYEGLFQNKGDVYVWLTDDERRMPVLVKSSIRIGSVKAALISAIPGNRAADLATQPHYTP